MTAQELEITLTSFHGGEIPPHRPTYEGPDFDVPEPFRKAFQVNPLTHPDFREYRFIETDDLPDFERFQKERVVSVASVFNLSPN